MSHLHDEEAMVGGNIVAPDLNGDISSSSSGKSHHHKHYDHQPQLHHNHHAHDADTVLVGDQVVSKYDLMEAFRGVLKPEANLLQQQPTRQFGNPAPMGLCGFAMTTFVLSLMNAHARHITTQNVFVGLAFFYGGAVQWIAGAWEIACGNTFGATAFASYGAFWMSFGAIQVPAFGIIEAYAGKEDELASALGFYLFGWFIFTTMLAICCIRTTVANFLLFFFLSITYLLLACSELTGKVGLTKAGGWVGIITAFVAWYNAFKAIANKENTFLAFKDYRMPYAPKFD